MSKRVITLRDIAEAAGLTRQSVSLALRNHPSVSAATRARVQAIAARMGYSPDAAVSRMMAALQRSPSRTTSPVIACLNTWRDRGPGAMPLWSRRFYAGAERRATEMGYRIERFDLETAKLSGRSLTRILHTRAVAGLIVPPLASPRRHMSIDWSRFACVAANTSMWKPDLHRIGPHQVFQPMLAARELKRAGYRRIGLLLTHDQDRRTMHLVMAGYLYQQSRTARRDRIPVLLEKSFTGRSLGKWIKAYRPDAIIALDDSILNVLAAAGFRCPDDTAFACLNRDPARVDVAGIDQMVEEIGAGAVEMVVAQIHRGERGMPSIAKQVFVPGKWIPGTTAPSLRASTR